MRPATTAHVWFWTALILLAASCSSGGGGSSTGTAPTTNSDPDDQRGARLAVLAPTLDDEIVTALIDAGDVDVAAVVVAPRADGSCPDAGVTAGVTVGCDRAPLADEEIGTVVAVTATSKQVDSIVATGDATFDLFLAVAPDRELPAASISVIPVDLSDEVTYADVIVGALVSDSVVVYDVMATPSGSVRTAVAVVDPGRFAEPPGASTGGSAEVAEAPEPRVVWEFRLDSSASSPGIHSRVGGDEESVYVLGFDGIAYAIDVDTGTERWRQQVLASSDTGSTGSYVAVLDGAMVVSIVPVTTPVSNRRVVAYDTATGAELWERTLDDDEFAGHPLAASGTFVFWLEDDRGAALIAVEPRTGREVWRSATNDAPGVGPLRLADGNVHTGTQGGQLLGVDAVDGSEVVDVDVAGSSLLGTNGIASRPTLHDGAVLFGADDGVFRSLNAVTGDVRWTYTTRGANLPSSPLVVDDVVVFGALDDSRIYGLDAETGGEIWQLETGIVLSSPVWTGDEVAIAAGSDVLAIDPSTGRVRWRLPTDDLVSDTPIAVDGDVIIQVRGSVLRLSPPDG